MKKYTIAIVTYHARFDQYFKPLIEKISKIFPDVEVVCIVNGHPDKTLQINYLNKITRYLKEKGIRYLTYDTHQSLAKCWNQNMILASNEAVLVMNDDTQVTELFRQEFEAKVLPQVFSTINSSWSHFMISKSIIKEIGWFDERLLGVGQEDSDYAFRMTMAGKEITTTECLGLTNYVVNQENPGWKNISGVSDNKYSSINKDFIQQKYWVKDLNPEHTEWTHETSWKVAFTPKEFGRITPQFYDFSTLDSSEQYSTSTQTKTGSLKPALQKIYWTLYKTAKKIYRELR